MIRRVAARDQIPAGGILGLEVAETLLALYRIGDKVFATSDLCPHAGCLLSETGDVSGNEVECLCHGSRFEIDSGINTTPPSTDPLETYPVELRGDDVFVDL